VYENRTMKLAETVLRRGGTEIKENDDVGESN
jgi:hypothetical protein